MEPTVRLYLHFPSPGVQRKRSMERPTRKPPLFVLSMFLLVFCLYFWSWVLFHFVFLHFLFRKVERKRSMERWGDEGPLLRKCFAESSAPLVPIVTFEHAWREMRKSNWKKWVGRALKDKEMCKYWSLLGLCVWKKWIICKKKIEKAKLWLNNLFSIWQGFNVSSQPWTYLILAKLNNLWHYRICWMR